MARRIILDRDTDPHFSQPIRQTFAMVVILALVAVGVWFIYGSVAGVLMSNPVLNGFIAAVFVIGVLSCFFQVFQLTSAVSWIEGFALDRPGHEFTKTPRLLASLSALLRGKGSRSMLTSASTGSILDSVATRLDEARDITRYIINLLIFLGLLGTFWGLANTVPAVVDTIRHLAPQEGEEGMAVFDRLMSGLEEQLGGMGTAFSSSLLGLAGSLVVGLLELFAGHGQNRFYRELEEWLSSITRIGLSTGDGEHGGFDGTVLAGILEQTAMQIESLREMVTRGEERRFETEDRLTRLASSLDRLSETLATPSAEQRAAEEARAATLERIAASQERMLAMTAQRLEDGEHVDAETRMRLRNIDVQLLRILEEMSAGRQDSLSEIRSGFAQLPRGIGAAISEAVSGTAGR
ncbi:biopolymer transporter ExbB [Oceanicella sp. SM1341]|uniref:biopolymer transporter ExbB n=1 Tax=Oceanicella sp. SM1341 TaxID=1548889 RepID=UPI001E512FE7|nr:biopolymer transporter ExbB [Oceanicella sp. SM1341]